MNSAYLNRLIRALDPAIYTAAVVPVIAGAAAAFYSTGIFHPNYFILTLLGMFLAQLGINLHNDYHDSKTGVDRNKTNSFVLLFPQAKIVLFLAWVCFLLAAGIGLYLDYLSEGHTILILAMLGGVIGYFYSAPPLRLSYLGIGEIATFLSFGPLAVSGAFYVQAQNLSLNILWTAVPVGILTSAILFVHHFPHFQTDREHRKKNLVARLGAERALKLLPGFIFLPYLILFIAVVIGQLPLSCGLVLLTLPLSIILLLQLRKEVASENVTTPVKSLVLSWHFLFGLTLAIGLAWSR